MAEQDPTPIGPELESILGRLERNLVTPDELRAWEGDRVPQQRRELLVVSGIEDVLSNRAIESLIADDVQLTPAVHWVQTWCMSHRPILGLFGATDSGKTMAAAWALARFPGLYAEANDLCRLRREFNDRRSRGAETEYNRAVRCALLVIDELGTEDDEAYARRTLEEVLNRRQKAARRTLLIGNLDKDALLSRYGERTWSRIEGVGVAKRVKPLGFRARGEG